MTGTLPAMSFVIPVRNDAVRLEACLRSIRQNDCPPELVEIVVVDNGSDDRSADVARAHGARVLSIGEAGVATLRNIGARHATTRILGFVDADHEVGRRWIRTAIENLQAHGVGAAGAMCLAPRDATWVQRAYEDLRGRPHGRHDVEWLGSGNMAVRRDAFEEVQGFDAVLETCEDVDLCNRLRAHGWRIVSDARLENVHHGDPRTLGELFRGELWRGRDNLRVTFRGPLSWRALPSALVPAGMAALLALAAAGIAARGAGWTAGSTLSGLALGALGTLSALRVVRSRLRGGSSTIPRLLQGLAVTVVYDLARALALIVRARHRTRRPAPAEGPSEAA